MKNLTELIPKAMSFADDSFESGEERQKALTERHDNDMKSDNWLSKSIRPLSLLVLLCLEILIVLLNAFGYNVSVEITAQIGLLLLSAFGFYFNSKKAERIADKNVKANIAIEKEKAKVVKKDERIERRKKRKLIRRMFKHEEEDFDKNTDKLDEI